LQKKKARAFALALSKTRRFCSLAPAISRLTFSSNAASTSFSKA